MSSSTISASTSAVINEQRAAGIDPAHIAGMRSQAAYDPRIYVVKA